MDIATAERLTGLETELRQINTQLKAIVPKLESFEAWKNRVAGAQHVVTVVGSAATSLLVAWLAHVFNGGGHNSK